MFELFNRYAQLKTLENERQERLNEAKSLYEYRIKTIKDGYPDLDEEVKTVRTTIQGEVEALGGNYEADNGKAEVQNRSSWGIVQPGNLALWLDNRNKSELWSHSFKKVEINKICTGLDIAGMDIPDGVEKIETPTLVITLTNYDTERQEV